MIVHVQFSWRSRDHPRVQVILEPARQRDPEEYDGPGVKETVSIPIRSNPFRSMFIPAYDRTVSNNMTSNKEIL